MTDTPPIDSTRTLFAVIARRARGVELGLTVLFALFAPIIYLAFTNHIWEDYFITFRHSRNLANGDGLVYNVGERVHGFTSPLGVLLPALFDFLAAGDSYRPALYCFRAVSIAAFVGAVVLVWFALRRAGCTLLTRSIATLLIITEVKSVSFSVNGMETAFMLFFVAATLHTIVAGFDRHWLRGGLAWAGLMWTRPDGCIFIAAFVGAILLFTVHSRRATLVGLFKSAGICTLVYLPWFLGAWWYYGSPVPQTILAKVGGYDRTGTALSMATHLQDVIVNFPLQYWGKISLAFAPAYALSFGGWPRWVYILAACLGLFAALYWVLPTRDRIGRSASFVFAILGLYFVSQNLTFPWYLPPAALCGFVALAGCVATLYRLARPFRLPAMLIGGGACLLVIIGNLATLTLATRQIQTQQQQIEFGHRQQIGLWLAEHVRPGQTVYLECFGYIGFFSNAHIDDFPGLVSPRVSELRREKNLAFHTLVPVLKPDWIIARPDEFELLGSLPQVREQYRPVIVFDANPNLTNLNEIAGAGYLRFDSTFYVLERIGNEIETASEPEPRTQ